MRLCAGLSALFVTCLTSFAAMALDLNGVNCAEIRNDGLVAFMAQCNHDQLVELGRYCTAQKRAVVRASSFEHDSEKQQFLSINALAIEETIMVIQAELKERRANQNQTQGI